MDNKVFVSRAQAILKKLGLEAKTTQLYELFSQLSDEKTWNIAKSKGVNFKDAILPKEYKGFTYKEITKEDAVYSHFLKTDISAIIKYFEATNSTETFRAPTEEQIKQTIDEKTQNNSNTSLKDLPREELNTVLSGTSSGKYVYKKDAALLAKDSEHKNKFHSTKTETVPKVRTSWLDIDWQKNNPKATLKIKDYVFIDVTGSAPLKLIADKLQVDPKKVIYFADDVNPPPIILGGSNDLDKVIAEAKRLGLKEVNVISDGVFMLPKQINDLPINLFVLEECRDMNMPFEQFAPIKVSFF